MCSAEMAEGDFGPSVLCGLRRILRIFCQSPALFELLGETIPPVAHLGGVLLLSVLGATRRRLYTDELGRLLPRRVGLASHRGG